MGLGKLKLAATVGQAKARPLQRPKSSLAAFPWRKLATVAGEHYIRLTVRAAGDGVAPSSRARKSAVGVKGQSPLRIANCRKRKASGLRWTRKLLRIRKKRYARPAGGSHLHGKRRLKNLFKNLALKHCCRRAEREGICRGASAQPDRRIRPRDSVRA